MARRMRVLGSIAAAATLSATLGFGALAVPPALARPDTAGPHDVQALVALDRVDFRVLSVSASYLVGSGTDRIRIDVTELVSQGSWQFEARIRVVRPSGKVVVLVPPKRPSGGDDAAVRTVTLGGVDLGDVGSVADDGLRLIVDAVGTVGGARQRGSLEFVLQSSDDAPDGPLALTATTIGATATQATFRWTAAGPVPEITEGDRLLVTDITRGPYSGIIGAYDYATASVSGGGGVYSGPLPATSHPYEFDIGNLPKKVVQSSSARFEAIGDQQQPGYDGTSVIRFPVDALPDYDTPG